MALVFDGIWTVTEATLPTGAFAYTGTITIRPCGQLRILEWDTSAGRYVGIGMQIGDYLLVSCGEQFAGLGFAHYRRDANGAVAVAWSTAELAGAMGSGNISIPAGTSFVGEHQLVQTLPRGERHGEWTLDIREMAGVYRLTWHKDSAVHWRGLGFATHDGLVVGWYPDISQLAFLEYQIDPAQHHVAHARWALGEYEGLGTETIVRMGDTLHMSTLHA